MALALDLALPLAQERTGYRRAVGASAADPEALALALVLAPKCSNYPRRAVGATAAALGHAPFA
eukprot:COSAG02_NODE_66616_length_255_cov_0.615385_1_plen_63_part_01